MTSYRRKIPTSPLVDPSDAFGTINDIVRSVEPFGRAYMVKIIEGPERAVVVCRRSDGEPLEHAWVKLEEPSGRYYRTYGIAEGAIGEKRLAKHYFRDAEDAGNYLKFLLGRSR